MTVWQSVGTWMQLVGVVIAGGSLVATYLKYATPGTLKRTILRVYWRTREAIQPGWHRPVRLRISYGGFGGPEADTRPYDLPADTDDALALLASYIREDRARIADVKNESSNAQTRLDWLERGQPDAIDQGVREYALGGIVFTALGILITAIGILLTLF